MCVFCFFSSFRHHQHKSPSTWIGIWTCAHRDNLVPVLYLCVQCSHQFYRFQQQTRCDSGINMNVFFFCFFVFFLSEKTNKIYPPPPPVFVSWCVVFFFFLLEKIKSLSDSSWCIKTKTTTTTIKCHPTQEWCIGMMMMMMTWCPPQLLLLLLHQQQPIFLLGVDWRKGGPKVQPREGEERGGRQKIGCIILRRNLLWCPQQ